MRGVSVAFLERDPRSRAIGDVVVRKLTPIPDMRGSFCEIHRDEWIVAPRPVQWDFVSTRSHVLRGVHVRQVRFAYIVMLPGHATIGLVDLRQQVPEICTGR